MKVKEESEEADLKISIQKKKKIFASSVITSRRKWKWKYSVVSDSMQPQGLYTAC